MNTRSMYSGQEFTSTVTPEVKSTPIVEGGMRFTFPPYGNKIEVVSLRNNKNCKLTLYMDGLIENNKHPIWVQ